MADCILEIHDYSLPDSAIMNPAFQNNYFIWQPDDTYIVLGRSNNFKEYVHEKNVIQDNVIIYKRPSGGETVILSPKMIVFSARFPFDKLKAPYSYFTKINNALIESLANAGIKGVLSKGISDLSLNDKKIMGSSMYLSKNILFYHAVLNVSEKSTLISKYLKHPGKEPDYRKGRDHAEFVTSLHEQGYNVDNKSISPFIESALLSLYK